MSKFEISTLELTFFMNKNFRVIFTLTSCKTLERLTKGKASNKNLDTFKLVLVPSK